MDSVDFQTTFNCHPRKGIARICDCSSWMFWVIYKATITKSIFESKRVRRQISGSGRIQHLIIIDENRCHHFTRSLHYTLKLFQIINNVLMKHVRKYGPQNNKINRVIF